MFQNSIWEQAVKQVFKNEGLGNKKVYFNKEIYDKFYKQSHNIYFADSRF